MNAELAELIALVAHGNAFLYGLRQPAELTQGNSTFQYVKSVRFVRPLESGSADSSVVATTTAGWLETIRSAGAERLWLLTPTVRYLNEEGLVNAGVGAIVVTGAADAEVWRGYWELISPRPTDGRIWSVRYEPMPVGEDVFFDPLVVDDAAADLRAVLADAAAVAVAESALRHFAPWFRDAAKLLDHPHPIPPYHPDMLPDVGYSLESRRLLAASTQAWVFGGMGSWNDVVIDDQSFRTAYDLISSRLWSAVIAGLDSAVNAFEPTH
jgi:hypothetical protein